MCIPDSNFESSARHDKHELLAECGNLTFRIIMLPSFVRPSAVSRNGDFILRKIHKKDRAGIDLGMCRLANGESGHNQKKRFHVFAESSEASMVYGSDTELTLIGHTIFLSWDGSHWYRLVDYKSK